MKNVVRITLLWCLFCSAFSLPLLAEGRFGGEVTGIWWANDIEEKGGVQSISSDAGAPGLRAELLMFERYGLQASQYRSDAGSNGASYTSVDFMWRALAPAENNFVAFGVGWQKMDLQGLDSETSGMRVSVEGRVELPGPVYAYGHGSYQPSLQDARSSDPALGTFEDLDAHEYEFGVAWAATPVIRVHAGYRANNLSFTQNTIQSAGGGPTQLTPSVGGGEGFQNLNLGPPVDSCNECTPAAMLSTGGATESSGFYLGVGFTF